MIDCLPDDNDNDDDSDDDSNNGSDNDNDEDGDGWQRNKWTKQQNNNRKNTLHCVSGNTNKQNKGSEVFAAKFCWTEKNFLIKVKIISCV